MDFNTMQRLYKSCNPEEPLEPGDNKNIDLDVEYNGHVRGKNWVSWLAKPIEFLQDSQDPPSILFTGLPGNGKTTELKRLKKRLENKNTTNLLTVYIAGEDYLDLSTPIEATDIIAAIVYCIEVALLQAEGKDSKQALQEGYLTRLYNWLNTTEITPKQTTVGGTAGAVTANLVLEMKANESFRQQVRKAVSTSWIAFKQMAEDEILLFKDRAKKIGFNGICVIFDSLERLRGLSTNWSEVMDSAERVFGSQAYHLQLPVPVVYTVPLSLLARMKIDRVMPVFRVVTKQGDPAPEGIAAMRELILRRIPLQELEQIFGGANLDARLEQLILWSGGYPREVLRMLRNALLVDTYPISDFEFERIRNEIWGSYKTLIYTSEYEWLAEIALSQEFTTHDGEHVEAAERMLLNNAILSYMNNEDWYDLHPAVKAIKGVQDAIRKKVKDTEEGCAGGETTDA